MMANDGQGACWRVRVKGMARILLAAEDQPLLEVLRAADLPVRHACRNGVCEICEARLVRGEVVQSWPPGRIAGAVDAPLIRLCTARALSDLELELMPWAWRR